MPATVQRRWFGGQRDSGVFPSRQWRPRLPRRGLLGTVAVAAAALAAAVLATAASADEPGPPPTGCLATPDRFASDGIVAVDLEGHRHPLDDAGQGVTVFVFLATECPVSNAAVVRLRQLAARCITATDDAPPTAAAAGRPVRFFGILADPRADDAAAAAHFRTRGPGFPVLTDHARTLRDRLRPTHVPEAFVVDGAGRIAYRGAIDDAFAAPGQRRAAVERHWLADAIAAVQAGRPPTQPFVPPVGCRLTPDAGSGSDRPVTYARDVAPIIHARCLACHRPGEVAPFPLTTCAEVADHAAMILEVIQARTMPPWMPDANPPHPFIGDRRLTDTEIDTVAAWVRGGCPPGDPADEPAPPTFPADWQLGPPDLVVAMPTPFRVPADGPDLLQHFVIPIDIPEDKVVAAVEFRPGERRVVHHAVLFLDTSGVARRLDAATPEPGYARFGGPGFLPSGALGGWSPGNAPRRLPGGRGRHLKQGSDLVIQVHYHPDGLERNDRSEVGLYFLDEPTPQVVAAGHRLVGSIWTSAYAIDIPAGDDAWTTSADYTLPKEVTLVGVVPHMHQLGRAVRVRAERPDGTAVVLVDIPRWRYAWQDEFYYREPFRLPAGTRIVTEGVFDNSATNPVNPSRPPRRVTWGDGTLDEMLFCFLLVSADRTEDLVHVVLDNLRHDLAQPRR